MTAAPPMASMTVKAKLRSDIDSVGRVEAGVMRAGVSSVIVVLQGVLCSDAQHESHDSPHLVTLPRAGQLRFEFCYSFLRQLRSLALDVRYLGLRVERPAQGL